MTINASAVNHYLNPAGNVLGNSIVGSEDEDTIHGAQGKDTIRGGDGNDKLYGDAGNDKIFGGLGDDSIWGGAGRDFFISATALATIQFLITNRAWTP